MKITSRDDGGIGPDDLGRFIVTQTCEACGGVRLRQKPWPSISAGVTIAELSAMPAARSARISGGLCQRECARPARIGDRPAADQGGHRAARLPTRGRARLLVARAHGAHALGRRRPTHSPRHANWRLPGRSAVRAGRTQHRPSRPRQRAATPGPPRLVDKGNSVLVVRARSRRHLERGPRSRHGSGRGRAGRPNRRPGHARRES